MDERSKGYLFVGYAPTGYHLWDEEKRKIIITKDVKFEEITTGRNKIQPITTHEEVEEEEENQNLINDIEETKEQNEDTEIQKEQEDKKEEEKIEETSRRSKRKHILPKKYTDYMFLTYQEATTGPDKHEWKKAINEEKKSLQENDTWDIIDFKEKEKRKPLHSKWIF